MKTGSEDYDTIPLSGVSVEDWREMRRGYIGGSDAGAIAGLNRFRSPYAVAADKLGIAPDVEDNDAMMLGRLFEEPIAALAHERIAERFPGKTLELERSKVMYVSKKYPWAIANLDGIIRTEDGAFGLEIKTASEYRGDQFADGKVPIEYEIQCIHYMSVLPELLGFWLAAVVGGNKFRLSWIERDEKAIRDLMQIEKEFFEMLERKEMPAPTGSEYDRDILKALYPYPEEDEIEVFLEEENEKLAETIAQANAEIKAQERRRSVAQNLLRAAIEEHKKARAGRFEITRVQAEVKEYVVAARINDYIKVREVG